MNIMKNLFWTTSLHMSQVDKRLFFVPSLSLSLSLFLFLFPPLLCAYNVMPVMIASECFPPEEWYGRTELDTLHPGAEL